MLKTNAVVGPRYSGSGNDRAGQFSAADRAPAAQAVARALQQCRVAPRTLQDLLHDAGASFTERVLELRLQKARRMLASPGQRHTQVTKIAYACGFRDISYFNRCFRRFGASPRELRT